MHRFLTSILLFLFFIDVGYSSDIPKPVFNEKFIFTNSSNVKEGSDNNFSGRILNSIEFKSSDIQNPEFTGMCVYPRMSTTNSGFVYEINKELISTNEITISMWINRENAQASWSTLLEMTDNNDKTVLSVTTESKNASDKNSGLSFYLKKKNSNSYRRFIDDGIAIETNKWTMITVTYSDNTGILSMYINGLLYKKTILEKGSMNEHIKELFIGRSRTGRSGLYGSVDEVIIFPKAIDSDSVKTIYNNEVNMNNYDGTQRKCKRRTCVLKFVEDSDPISDMFGKSVFTKKTFVYDCTYIIDARGACEAEDRNLTYELPDMNETGSYIDTFEGGDLSAIAAIASAQSYASKVMTGWKGYCIYGIEEEFSWTKDPYFWGSMALTLLSGSLADSASSNAQTAKDIAENAEDEISYSMNAFDEELRKQTADALAEVAKKQLLIKMGQYALCAAQAGLDVAKIESPEDDVPCDPVDQMCSQKDMSYDDQTYTLSTTAYNDMLVTNPDYSKYISIVSQKDGQVSFIITHPSDTENLNDEELKKKEKQAKEDMKQLQYLAVAAFAVECVGSVAFGKGASTSSTQTDTGDDGFSAADAISGVANAVASAFCGPPCSIGVQVLGKFATSFKEIDTCDDKDDAAEKGDRHSSTYDATRLGLCKFINRDCLIDSKTGSGCQLTAKHYCCYDSVLTKVLAEQVKAQKGLSWSHCTGLSLSEFMSIDYKSCKNTSGADGTKLPYNASVSQRHAAYQFADKCIDYRSYINYISKTSSGMLNADDIKDLIDTKSNASSTCSQ